MNNILKNPTNFDTFLHILSFSSRFHASESSTGPSLIELNLGHLGPVLTSVVSRPGGYTSHMVICAYYVDFWSVVCHSFPHQHKNSTNWHVGSIGPHVGGMQCYWFFFFLSLFQVSIALLLGFLLKFQCFFTSY